MKPPECAQTPAGGCALSCMDHKNLETTIEKLWPTVKDATAPTREEFALLTKELIPQQLICNHTQIKHYKNITHGQAQKNDIVSYIDVTTRTYREIPIITGYFERFVYKRKDDHQCCPSLTLIGNSSLGNSNYVRRLGDYVYIDGDIQCSCMNPDVQFMVSDDVPIIRYKSTGC
ncbi:hypothetical protein B9Z19DRAFT_1065146 [Tuber borchii]|uniref:Uncharacterized protein n=1 Tax=Tuber borchii TaxID=42251 RepID=A0A2T6ZS83_TUBBO|nr:hypothetical protein B9Z19DRAFT_1065146 [Tuber borchii]